MKRLLLIGLVIGVVVILLQKGETGRVVYAAPENPNAPVDLFDVETYYQGIYGAPGEPGATLGAWIEVHTLQSGTYTVYIGVFDHQEYQWVVSAVKTFNNYYVWRPSWVFKNVPDSYEVYLFYESAGGWVFADKAVGWIQADQDLQCESGHCPFSPNEYTYPFMSTEGDYKWVKQYSWYFDNDYYGDTVGTDRLTRLQYYTNNPYTIGKLQIEYRRVDAYGNNREGWDAGYEVWYNGVCVFETYGEATNLPQPWGHAHEELTGACSIQNDEEAEIWTQGTENMEVYLGHDPTNVYDSGDPRVYYVGIKFYRRPEQQGQNFVLQTEFELLEGKIIDTFLDVIVSTKYIYETF